MVLAGVKEDGSGGCGDGMKVTEVGEGGERRCRVVGRRVVTRGRAACE